MGFWAARRKFVASQPRWLKKLMWLVGLPAWAVFATALGFSVGYGEFPTWGWIGFAISALLVLIQWHHFRRSRPYSK